MTENIVIVGVGGQGTLLTSRIIGNMFLNQGYDVKISEVHGMSQRGGSVITYVRYGDRVCSPMIEYGQADIMLAFEELEAYRALPYLNPDGKLLVNTQQIMPMSVITGAKSYPDDLIRKFKSKQIHVSAIDALYYAKLAGNIRCANTVMIGLLAQHTTYSESDWMDTIKSTVPEKYVDANIKAFHFGLNYQQA